MPLPPRVARLLVALGLLLQFSLWLALAAGGLRLARLALAVAGEGEDSATADPTIAEGAATALLLIQAGELLALSGLGIMAVAIALGRPRERWMFWGGIAALAAWIPLPPYGTLLGVTGIAAFVLARHHFRPGPAGA